MSGPVWREPARGQFFSAETKALSGPDLLRGMMRGTFPDPPLTRLTGMRVTDVGLGTATMAMPASPWWQTGAGVFTAGTLAFVADGALGAAVMTAAGPGVGMTSTEIALDFLRPATIRSERIIGRGRIIHSTQQQALAEVFIDDSRGRMLAHGTSRGLLFHYDPASTQKGQFEAAEEDGTPDPYECPADGDVLGEEYWNTCAGIDVMRDLVNGRFTAPVFHFTGIRATACSEGAATLVMPTTHWLTNGYGIFYGGALALLADLAQNSAVLTTLPKATSFAPMDFKINFLRPVFPGDQELTATARVVHAGKRIAVVSCDIVDHAGKQVVLAMETLLILPGRPWARPVSVGEEVPVER